MGDISVFKVLKELGIWSVNGMGGKLTKIEDVNREKIDIMQPHPQGSLDNLNAISRTQNGSYFNVYSS